MIKNQIEKIITCTKDYIPTAKSNYVYLVQSTFNQINKKFGYEKEKYTGSYDQCGRYFVNIIEHADTFERIAVVLNDSGVCSGIWKFRGFDKETNKYMFYHLDNLGNINYLFVYKK